MAQTLHALGDCAPSGGGPSASEPIRVLIAEPHGAGARGLPPAAERQDDMRVAAEAATGEEAVAAALRTRPDVVLMDVGLAGVDGLEATRRIIADTAPGVRPLAA